MRPESTAASTNVAIMNTPVSHGRLHASPALVSPCSQPNDLSLDISACSLSIDASSPLSPMLSTPICSTPLSARLEAVKISDRVQKSTSQTSLVDPAARVKKYLASEPSARHGFIVAVQHSGVTALARAEILMWLQELVLFHECDMDVFVGAAELLDRLLAATQLKPKHLRVAAVACFLIASKCLAEEAEQPLVSDLVANCSPEFTLNDLKRMELVILDKLHWMLPSTTSVRMLHDVISLCCFELQINQTNEKHLFDNIVSQFVICTYSYELLRFKPSVVAVSLLIPELNALTGLSEEFLLSMLSTELGIDLDAVDLCRRLAVRHLKMTAKLQK